MFKLEYTYDCLDGKYFLCAEGEDEITYAVDSSIPVLASKQGSLDETDSRRFLQALKDCGIERWAKEYKADLGSIEDAIRWSLTYIINGKEYFSKGEESYEPYNYNKLIETLMIIDENTACFRMGETDD